MKTLARLHQFTANRDFYVRRFLIGLGRSNDVSCWVDGCVWSDFGHFHRYTTVEHDYAFILGRRVLDVLVSEKLATFDAIRVRLDDIGGLRKEEPEPEYYAIKVPYRLDLNYYSGEGPGGEPVAYWVPDFSRYDGHPFVEVVTKEGGRKILCIPRIAELAKQHKWGNCAFACISAGGYYYSKEHRRRAESTFRIESAFIAKEIFVEAGTIQHDLEAARRLPQGIIVSKASDGSSVAVPSVEEILAETFLESGRKAIEPLSSSSARGKAKVWDFACKLDVHFQKDVPAVFEDHGGTVSIPDSFVLNVIFLRDHFGEVWNSFAARINDLIQQQALPVPASCVLDNIKFVFYNALVSKSAKWDFKIVVVGVPGSFSARFVGLELLDARLS